MLNFYSFKTYSLLDLACGKGGDINKWNKNKIKNVRAIDFNEQSIEEANNRYNKSTMFTRCSFQVKDLSTEHVKSRIKFNTITCFFAIHYFFGNNKTIDLFLDNIDLLEQGGFFIVTTFSDSNLKKINYTLNNSKVNINPVIIDNNKIIGNSISVKIKGTVLDTQTDEFIVNSNLLIDKLFKKGLVLVENKDFSEYYKEWPSKDNLKLSKMEKDLSFLNKTFVFVKL